MSSNDVEREDSETAQLLVGSDGIRSRGGGREVHSDTASEEEEIHTIDDAINAVGMGPFQWKVFALCAVAAFFVHMQVNNISVLLPIVKDRWALSEEGLGALACFFHFGTAVGALVFGRVADLHGRLEVYKYSFFAMAIFGAISAYAPTIQLFIAARSLLGMAYGSNIIIQLVLIEELCPANYRANIVAAVEAFYGAGTMATVALTWVATHYEDAFGWRLLLLLISIPPVILGLVYYFVFPNSPHYAAATHEHEEAIKLLTTIAQTNGASASVKQRISSLNLNKPRNNIDAVGESSFAHLFSPVLRPITTVLILVWMFAPVATRLFMWIPMYLKGHTEVTDRALETYASAMIMSTGETVGATLVALILSVVERRYILRTSLVVLTIFSIVLGFLYDSIGILLSILFVSVFGRAVLITVYLYTVESYPTLVRSTALGLLNAVQWVVVLGLDWLMAAVLTMHVQALAAVFAIAYGIATIASFLLPYDTRHRWLAEEYYVHVGKGLKPPLDPEAHSIFQAASLPSAREAPAAPDNSINSGPAGSRATSASKLGLHVNVDTDPSVTPPVRSPAQ